MLALVCVCVFLTNSTRPFDDAVIVNSLSCPLPPMFSYLHHSRILVVCLHGRVDKKAVANNKRTTKILEHLHISYYTILRFEFSELLATEFQYMHFILLWFASLIP